MERSLAADTVLTESGRAVSGASHGSGSGSPGGRRLPWPWMALAAAVVIAAVAAVPPLRRAAVVVTSKVILLAMTPFAPSLENFEGLPQASRILASDGSVLADLEGGQPRDQTSLRALPDHVPRAVLTAEDVNFYHHDGVDPTAVLRAILRSAQGDEQGGSTITQQLAKLNYTGSQRTLMRKFREVQYAVRLEREYSKDQLLERYLNQVYFGDGAYGIGAAARSYFSVPADQLSPAQAATLAAKIKAPEDLDPRRDPRSVQSRRDHILRRMQRRDWISSSQLEEALATPLRVAPPSPAAAGRAPHFVEYVKREAATVDALGGSPEARSKQLFTGGYTVETTLDPKALDAASRAARAELGGPSDPEVAIATVVPGDGAVRALFGGKDQARKFDLASQGRRQPGSSFKPLVYLAALRDGIDPRSTFDASSPKALEYRGTTFTVDNYEGQGTGTSTIDNALTHSINVVFAQLTLAVGPENVMRTAESLGVANPSQNVGANPAVGLGGLTRGVTPLEQAAAFATFAARGVYAEPYAITRIVDRRGEEVHRRRPKVKNAFDAKEVGVLNAALMSVVRQGTGTAANIGRPVAGKTGTTQNFGDAWFVGFVPQLSTAVWVGHPEQVIPMTNVHGRRVSGGSFPAEIWAAYMRQAVARLPVQDIFTASPDSLALRPLGPPPPPPPAPVPTPTLPPATVRPPDDVAPPPPPPGYVPPVVDVPPPTYRRTPTTTTPPRVTTTTRAP